MTKPELKQKMAQITKLSKFFVLLDALFAVFCILSGIITFYIPCVNMSCFGQGLTNIFLLIGIFITSLIVLCLDVWLDRAKLKLETRNNKESKKLRKLIGIRISLLVLFIAIAVFTAVAFPLNFYLDAQFLLVSYFFLAIPFITILLASAIIILSICTKELRDDQVPIKRPSKKTKQ